MGVWIAGAVIAVACFIGLIIGFRLNRKNWWPYWLVGIVAGLMMVGGGVWLDVRSASAIHLETIGRDSTNTIVYVALTSTGNYTDEDLGETLRKQWQDKLVQIGAYHIISVVVFDDKAVAERRLTISADELANEQAQIYSHIIAAYYHNRESGENATFFYAGDPNMSVVKKIQY